MSMNTRRAQFAVPVAMLFCFAIVVSRTVAAERTAQVCSPCIVTFNVNSTTDAIDANPGDGFCATAGQACTLRAAIMEGNATLAGYSVVINVPAGVYTLSIPGIEEHLSATGDLNIARAMSIVGAGSANTIIQASPTASDTGIDRIFTIQGDFSALIRDVTLRYGRAQGAGPYGGAIYLTANLTLDRCVVVNNEAGNSGAILVDSFEGAATPMLTLSSCLVTGNHAVIVGAISLSSSSLVAQNSTISDNIATTASYGGINAFSSSTLSLTGCTISGNTAVNNGGAITLGVGDTDATTATLTNCTISGNAAAVGASVLLQSAVASLNLNNVTSASNSTGMGRIGGLPTITLKNTILADNASNCTTATFTSLGHNISSDASCTAYLTAAGDMNNTDPRLGALLLYPPSLTATHRLLPGSPALDSGSGCSALDQRGVLRPQGVQCDIGAFEFAGATRFDSSADRKSDLFWRNFASGSNSMWFMNGPAVAFSVAEASVPDPNFKVVGIGDFDGDAKADILWRNTASGANIIWFMDGGTVASTAVLTTVPDPNWIVAGVGDFQGDGKADIFWHHVGAGSNSVWLMNGSTIAVSAPLPPVTDTTWAVAGVGDFQGDAKDDVVWRNTATGANVVWLLNGPALAVSAVLPAMPDGNWNIAGVGDFDGDGKSDLLWRNSSSGDNAVWFMNGLTVGSMAAITPVPDTSWSVARVADFQGDGRADIIWRNSSSGANSQWLMNGATVALSSALPSIPDPNWHVVP